MRDPIPSGEWGLSRNPLLWLLFLVRLLVCVVMTLVLLIPLFLGTQNFSFAVAKLWARIFLFVCGYRITRRGHYRQYPCVIVSNHLAYMDIMLLLAGVPGQFRFIADEFLFAVPLLSQVMKKCGCLSVRRSAQSLRRMLAEAAAYVERGIPVLIFPEGGVNRSGERGQLVRVEPGFLRIAVDAAVPIQPLTLRGTAEVQQRFDRILQRVALSWADTPLAAETLVGLSREELLERLATANAGRYRGLGPFVAGRGRPPVE